MQSDWANALRTTTAIELKISLLLILFLFALMYASNRSWITTNRLLASIPIQRFKWKTETHLSSSLNRFGSLLSSSLILAVLISAYGLSTQANLMINSWLYFIGLSCLIILAFLFKWLSINVFFSLHDHKDLGTQSLDYQYGFNQLAALFLFAMLCLDVFYFHLDSPIRLIIIYFLVVAYIARLIGHIALLLNNLSYPLISLFIYLCAFEIAPALVITKVVFENS